MIHSFLKSGLRAFGVIWFGQVISLTGTNLTGFALGVWVFQRTGSVTRFALISICMMLPGILISPIAGAFVDRWDRRRVMILSDSGSGLSSLFIAILLFSDHLAIWHLYPALIISSLCSALQVPAYHALIPLLVPKEHLGRTSGMLQLAQAVGQVSAPVLGGLLLSAINIGGVILIDFATFLFALFTLGLVRIPRTEFTKPAPVGQGALWQQVAAGWRYLIERPGLFGLLAFIAATNFTLGFVLILIPPLVLGFTSAVVLGTVLSFGGLGMVLGSLVVSVWGGPKSRIRGVLGGTLIESLLLFAGGLQPSAPLIAMAAFVFLFCEPFIFGCSQVIWQTKVPSEIQGRVFAFRNMISLGMLAFAYMLAGPLADYVFEPLLAVQGALAPSVGRLIGVGPGRGIGFLFMVMGFLTLLVTVIGYLFPRLRFVEKELPDMLASNYEG